MDFQNIFDFKIESVQKIEKGFSVDDKYIINNQYLVRVISKDRVERFKYVYDVQKLNQTFSYVELLGLLENQEDEDLVRLCTEYLPLKFSRRHGDPSRPWNKFSINTKDEIDGSKIF